MGLQNAVAKAAGDDDVLKLFFHGAGKGAELFVKQTPLVGIGLTVLTTAEEMAVDAEQKKYRKMLNEAFAGAAEAAGGTVGFAVGDALREVVRGVQVKIFGEAEAAEKSGLRKIAERAFTAIKPLIDKINGGNNGGPAGFGGGMMPAMA